MVTTRINKAKYLRHSLLKCWILCNNTVTIDTDSFGTSFCSLHRYRNHALKYRNTGSVLFQEINNMKPDIEELRRKYMDNPPEGMTSMDIRRMSEEELPDIDYFLNKLTLMTILEKNFFTSFKSQTIHLSCPHICGLFSI